jgi:hypothetical protein
MVPSLYSSASQTTFRDIQEMANGWRTSLGKVQYAPALTPGESR